MNSKHRGHDGDSFPSGVTDLENAKLVLKIGEDKYTSTIKSD
jgi:hypothetical protein